MFQGSTENKFCLLPFLKGKIAFIRSRLFPCLCVYVRPPFEFLSQMTDLLEIWNPMRGHTNSIALCILYKTIKEALRGGRVCLSVSDSVKRLNM
jgi:hypothetical protein